ncbi:response regulator [Rhizobium leguminosarum]
MNLKYILFVDDDEMNRELFSGAIEDWNEKQKGAGRQFVPEIATSYEEAIKALDRYKIDCALLDLRLPQAVNDRETPAIGNKLAKEVLYSQGLPLAVLSGHPGEIDESLRDLGLIEAFDKGDADGYESALDRLADKWHMMETLRAAKSSIDESTAEVFAKRLWPRWSAFASLEGSQEKLNRIIARQYVSHIADILGLDNEVGIGWHPFENYNVPPLFDNRAHTGDIFRLEDGLWLVLSPQCDMATQKVPNVILAGCAPGYDRWPENVETLRTSTNEKLREKASAYFRNLVNQNLPASKHFLPPLPGEVEPLLVSFGNIKTVSLVELNSLLDRRVVSVSSPFISNLVQRFGAFISRTGQPNLEVDHFAN